MATAKLLLELTSTYEKLSGQAVRIESVGGVDAAKRVQLGEYFDVVFLASDAIDGLISSGQICTGSKVDLVQSGVAVAVRLGSATLDLSSEAAVRAAVLNAKSLCYSTGPSGVALLKLFERWGIAEKIAPRLVKAPPGVPVGSLVASGQAALGFQQLSELIHLTGIQVLGPLPAAIQITTTFSAAIATTTTRFEAAQALLTFLASPQTVDAKRKQGMEPA